jgi:hypothetical protein
LFNKKLGDRNKTFYLQDDVFYHRHIDVSIIVASSVGFSNIRSNFTVVMQQVLLLERRNFSEKKFDSDFVLFDIVLLSSIRKENNVDSKERFGNYDHPFDLTQLPFALKIMINS